MPKEITKGQALGSLRPKANFGVVDGVVEGYVANGGGALPSDSEINAEITRLRNEVTATEYQRKRAATYPPIGDQLDDLYKKGAFSTEMAAKLKKVKDDNHKP